MGAAIAKPVYDYVIEAARIAPAGLANNREFLRARPACLRDG